MKNRIVWPLEEMMTETHEARLYAAEGYVQ